MTVHLRAGIEADVPFLAEMIREAAFPPGRRPPLDEAVRAPHAACWIEGWGRAGDLAVIAVDATGARLGAAWCRVFEGSEPGMSGFIDRDTPVVAIAVVEERRGQGIGAAMLEELQAAARAHGVRALSLSVGRTNPALRLYERLGWVRWRDEEGRAVMRMALG